MPVPCVIYARVSTKEQQDEGYSIPAQLKAIRAFCEHEGFEAAAEFVEAESAGKAGRTQFGLMVRFLAEHPSVRTVVAHKLDRLYRNFSDQVKLEEELGVRARYVVGDVPDSPQGALLRDVQLSVSKFYLGNLAEEVRKGMDEKVAQGGWPHRAPLGYANDRSARSLVVDPAIAPLVRHAFERYASGLVSLSDLAGEMESLGLRSRGGNIIRVSALHVLLHNPIYCGLIRYKGVIHKGIHEPLVTVELFERVQDAFVPNRRRNNAQTRSYVLRDFLYCEECGCKITAGTHKQHVYYRCTHSKGGCSERSYTREELLMEQMETLLSRVALDREIVEALYEEAVNMEAKGTSDGDSELARVQAKLDANRERSSKLLDALLSGVVDEPAYRAKSEELATQRAALELAAARAGEPTRRTSSQVKAILDLAANAHLEFQTGNFETRRRTLAGLLCNLTVSEGRIASYQWKSPIGVLEMDSNGALLHPWWAILDLNQ